MRALHTDYDARTFRTAEGTPVPHNRIAGAYASNGSDSGMTPELLLIDGYDGTGDVLARHPLPFLPGGEYIDLPACERLLADHGYAVARVIVDGQTPQPDAWTLVADGCVATVVRGA